MDPNPTSGARRTPTRPKEGCAIAHGLEIIGGRWTLLIVAQLLSGPQTFSQLRRHVEGISSPVLIGKLRRLITLNVVCEVEGPPASRGYALTAFGRDTSRLVLALRLWGEARPCPGSALAETGRLPEGAGAPRA